MGVIFIKELTSLDEVRWNPYMVKERPHVLVIEAGEGSCKIEQEKSPCRVAMQGPPDGSAHIDNISGYISFGEERRLSWAAEGVSKRYKNKIQ